MTKKTPHNGPEETVPNEATAETQAAGSAGETPSGVVQLTTVEFEQVKAHIEGLQKEKEALAQEREEAVALAQRMKADRDNYCRRNENVARDSYQEGLRDCVKALLPGLDSFDIALQNTENVDPRFADGMRLVQRNLLDALKKQGVQEIPAQGLFDPNLHDAVLQEPAEGKEKGEILEVLRKGYEVSGRIVRHSMVKVAE